MKTGDRDFPAYCAGREGTRDQRRHPDELVAAYRREHAGEEPPLTLDERARLREQEREIRELKMELEFLKKGAAYFAKDHR